MPTQFFLSPKTKKVSHAGGRSRIVRGSLQHVGHARAFEEHPSGIVSSSQMNGRRCNIMVDGRERFVVVLFGSTTCAMNDSIRTTLSTGFDSFILSR